MRLRFIATATVAALALAGSAHAGWYNASWKFRKVITLNGGLVPAAQVNYPALVALTAPDAHVQANTQASGNDILFTAADGTTKLAHEIESYNSANGALVAWVNVPALASGTNTTIYVYYGNAAAANQQNRPAVWDANFRGVWHLVETPANGVAGHIDSTSNNFTGTPQGFADGTPGSTNAVGVISGADNFLTDTFNVPAGNTVNRVEVPDNALLRPNGDFTVEAWVNLLNPTFDQHLVYKWDSGGSNFAFQLQVGLNGGPVAAFQRLNNVGAGGIVNGTTILLPNTWYHMVGVKSGANVLIYLNGTLEGTLGGIAGTIYANTPQALVIGATFFGGGGLNGREDEVRFSSVARSASWLRTEYNNVSNQGVGPGKFILSSLLDVASCCGLTTVETVGSTIAVTGTDQFALSFDAGKGAGLDELWDLVEDPGKTNSLVGGLTVEQTLHGFHFQYLGVEYRTTDAVGAKLDLLEATPTRVRVRGDTFFQQVGGTALLPAIKGIGDYSVYGTGRTALRFTEINSDPSVRIYDKRRLEVNGHYTSGAPLNDYNPCYQGNPACFSSGAVSAPGQEDWVMGVRDSPGARTDFLTILSQDWAQASTIEYDFLTTAGQEWFSQYWQDLSALAIPASQTWNLLTYFKPTDLGSTASPWLDPAVISRSSDYRGRSAQSHR